MELGAVVSVVVAVKALGVGLALILVATAASAQEPTPVMPGEFHVRLDQEQYPVAGRIVGQIHNNSSFRVTAVRLDVQGLDAAGQLVGRTRAWAFGDIAPGGDAAFAFAAMPNASSYRIGVLSYDLVSRPAAAEAP